MLCACAFAAGCTKAGEFENENDHLRARVLELENTNDALQDRAALHEAHVSALKQQLANLRGEGSGATEAMGLSPQDVPHAVALRFARYTGPVDMNGDGKDDVIRLYVHTLDQGGRFVPVVARAVVQVVAIEPGLPPRVLAQKKFSPEEINAAYRAALTGTHYTLEVPLPGEVPAEVDQATVHLSLIDGATGVEMTAQQVMPLKTTAKQ